MRPDRITSRLFAIIFVGFLVVASSSVDETAMAETITAFDGGSTQVVVALEAGGTDASTNLLVPVDGTVKSATFDVTGVENGPDNYPNRLQVSVGSLADRVYVWAERTYGPMGLQDRFTDLQESHEMVFEGSGSNSSLAVRLPAGADITSAQLRLTGEQFDAGWSYPTKLSHKMGNNYVPINVGYRSTPQLIDFDGDGDLDILTGGYASVGGTIKWIWYFENTGNKTTPKWEEDTSVVNIPFTTGFYYSAPRFLDLDEDGDFDLVVGMYNGAIQLFWNTGSNSNPTWTADGPGTNEVFYGIDEGYYASTDFADMDDDGDLDLAYGKYVTGSETSAGISGYRNDYSGGTWSWSSASFFSAITTDQYSFPALVDFDGDGDFDIIVGNYNGTIGYYENTGSASSPSWTQVPEVEGDIDVGSMSSPSVGDLDGDGNLDLVIGSYDGILYFYSRALSDPTGVSIDVGGDGTNDWTKSGKLVGAVTTSDLSSAVESNLKGTYSFTDAWGNNFYDVVFSISTKAAGVLTIDQLTVEYVYTVTSRDFTGILNDYIKANIDKADANGNLKVPVIMNSGSKGGVKLSNLKIVVDRPPVWSTIPSTYGIDEDTKNLQLIDLFAYISDDYTADEDLVLKVVQLDHADVVKVTLEGGRFIGVDAETGSANDNWNGKISLYISAVDGLQHLAKSATFTIEVRPVNDVPTIEGAPPAKVNEDEPFSYQIAANDVDGDHLTYNVTGMPSGMKLSADGLVTWTPTNDDVGVHNLTITVRDPSGTIARLEWTLEVVNVNDAPFFKGLPATITVTEGKAFTIDLKNKYGDVDDPVETLNLVVENAFATYDGTNKVVSLYYPKESGMTADKLVLILSDPHGATTTWVVLVDVIRVDKLDLLGIPDQTAVEEDSWTLDIKPYLYNVEDFNKLVITTSSSYVTVSGTKLNLHYPQDALPGLEEVVRVTAKQKDEVATDEFKVTLLKLGHDLLVSLIPAQDVLENEVATLDITPYIKNAPEIGEVEVSIKASEHVSVSGRVLTFLYPMYYDLDAEEVTVMVRYREFGASRAFTVNIHDAEDDFYLAEIPAVTVTETVPESFNIKQYIRNADDVDRIDAWTDSPYADVNRFDIQLTYPQGFTGDLASRDVVLRVTISDGIHEFTRQVTVHVLRLGKELQLSGIGDRTVYYGDDLVIDVGSFLYNVDDIGDVQLSVAPSTYAVVSGLVVTFNYPAILSISYQEVTFTVTEGPDVAIETIIIYLEQVPTSFVFGPIGPVTATEDVPYVLDVAPYLKNMAPGITYKLGVHSDHATVDGFTVTLLYETETAMDEIVRINVTGTNGDFDEQDVYVHVKVVNDPPVLAKTFAANYNVKEGDGPVVINLTTHFTDVDTSKLAFSCDEAIVVIDQVNGTATIEFKMDAARPDDLKDVVIWAFDPDQVGSRTASNPFDITFYLADEEPPGPDGPDTGLQEPGGSSWAIVGLLLVAVVAGGGWMYYRRRKPAQL